MRFGTLVHATALVVAPLPAVAAAQVTGDEPPTDPIPPALAATAFVWHPGGRR
jgi:hypothetical protein